MEVRYKNPFGKTKQPDFIRDVKKVETYKNGFLVKVHNEQFDYVIDGICVTQRVGGSINMLKLLVDNNIKAKDYDGLHRIDSMFKVNK